MPTLDELLIQKRAEAVKRGEVPAQPRASSLDELLMQKRAMAAMDPNASGQAPPQPIEMAALRPPADPSEPPMPRNAVDEFAAQIGRRMVPQARIGQFAGGTLGAVAGPLVAGRFIPGPVDDMILAISAIVGAGAGGGIGEAAQQGLSRYEDIDFAKIGQAAAAEALSETGGRIAGGAAGAIGRKLVSNRSVQKFAQAITRNRIDPTDAGNRLYQFVGRQIDTPSGLAQGAIHQELDQFFGVPFSLLKLNTNAGQVSIRSMKTLASEALAKHYAGEEILNPVTTKALRDVLKQPDEVSFPWLRGHKTHWQGLVAQLKHDAKPGERPLIALASEAKRLQVDPSAWKGIDPALAPQIADLNRQYAKSQELMEMVFPRRWTEALKAKPEKAVDLIGNPSEKTSRGAWLQQIRNTKKALMVMPDGKPVQGGKEAWDNLRQAWWSGQINKFSASGDFDTMGFEKMLNLLGDKATGELFDPGELKRVQQLNKLLQGKNARILNQKSLLGTVGIAGGIGAGIGWDVYHDASNGDYVGVAKDGAFVMSAGVLAAAARSDKYARLVSTILRAKPLTRETIPAAVRLARLLKSDQLQKDLRLKNDIERARVDSVDPWGYGAADPQAGLGLPR